MSAIVDDKNANVEAEDSDEEFTEVPDADKTPVTIITGFLGAGKTTLVNYILKEQKTWKICVVENEFGEVAIDDDLVKDNIAAKEDIITMDNGCVCCSVRGDLVRTFGMLVHRRKEFDAIILETTGLADPSPIVFTFNTNAIIQDNFRIDSVVCLVDAKHVHSHLDEVKPEGDINEAERQIAFADRIILNKLDLVNAEELEDVEDRLKSMNSFAAVIKTLNSRAPLDKVLGLGTFSLEKVVEVDPSFMDSEDEEEEEVAHVHDEHCTHDHADAGHVHDEHCSHEHKHEHSHEHAHEHHDHDHKAHDHADDHSCHDHAHEHVHDEHCGHSEPEKKKPKTKKKRHNLSLVSSVGFTIENGELDVIRFNTFMSELLKEKSQDIYRSKGVLAFKDQGDVKFVFQGVHEQITFGPSEHPWGADETRTSKMVFIGKNLDYDSLQASLLSCSDDPTVAKVKMHKRA